MGLRLLVAPLAAVLVIVPFAGCLDLGSGRGESFEPIDPPVWEAGYAWTYAVTASASESHSIHDGVRSETDSEAGTVTMQVLNTTVPLDGADVYYLGLDQSIDHPLFHEAIQAVTQDGLEVAGYSYGGYGPHPPEPRTVARDDLSPMSVAHGSSYDPCDGVPVVHPVAEEARFPTFEFPLDDGRTWTGTWGNDFLGLKYVGHTHGMTVLTVPAGTFSAVYSTVDFRVANLPTGEGGPTDFTLRAEYWYSPEVRYLVKGVTTASARGGLFYEEGMQGFSYVSKLELASFDLTAGPEQPVIAADEDDDTKRWLEPRNLRIVPDRALPFNVAEEYAEVNFVLAEGEGHPYPSAPGESPHVDSPPGPFELDFATHEVAWLLQSHDGQEWSEATGDTFSYAFARGGLYDLSATIRPLQCGGAWLGSTRMTIETFWEKTFNVSMSAGLPRTVGVTAFPVESGATQGSIDWRLAPTFSSTNLDRGHPRLVRPGGVATVYPSAPTGKVAFEPSYWGTWQLQWETEAPTTGEDLRITVRIDYSPSDHYH